MLDIAVWPDEILKKETRVVTSFDEEIEFLVDQMFETMYHHRGLGLAANQVNLDKRILVMDCKDKNGKKDPKVFINPEIVRLDDKMVKMEEGCLSFKGFLVDVERPTSVNFNFQSLDGTWIKNYHLSGLAARVFLHEEDHLRGVTFLKYTSRFHRNMITNRMSR